MTDSERKKLGDNWGALSGMTPEEALNAVINMHAELAEENRKLRAASGGDSSSPPPVENVPKPDWDAIQKGTQEEAEQALREYSEAVFKEMSAKQKREELESNFPSKRQEAIVRAQQILANEGRDFSELARELDAAMTEGNGVTKEQQIDPNNWVQAFHYLASKTGKGLPVSRQDEVYTEPVSRTPSPRSRGNKPEYEMPEEKHAHRMWERELGEKISMEDWVAFREMSTLDDYEEFLREKRSRERDR